MLNPNFRNGLHINFWDLKIYFSELSDYTSDDEWETVSCIDDNLPSIKVIDKFTLDLEILKITQQLVKGKRFTPHVNSDCTDLFYDYGVMNKCQTSNQNIDDGMISTQVPKNIVLEQYFCSLDKSKNVKGEQLFYT